MQEDMSSLQANYTYELVQLSKGKKTLMNQCVFRVKQTEDTTLPGYKVRLVVKGYNQLKGMDFDLVDRQVIIYPGGASFRAGFNLEIEQMDVKTAW